MFKQLSKLYKYPRSFGCIGSIRCNATVPLNIETLEKESAEAIDVDDEELRLKEEAIANKCNKSRLSQAHYNILHGKTPFKSPMHWSHGTLRYQRTMYGRYGSESNVDPSLCFLTKEELENKREYERVAHPYTIPEMLEKAKTKREHQEEIIRKRQEDIGKKMEKLEFWKLELINKIKKKESEALAAKERKEKLIEEVRRHFGYTVDPRDDKFKEMLEKKEKQQKKEVKEARRKAKEDTLILKLTQKDKKGETDETGKLKENIDS